MWKLCLLAVSALRRYWCHSTGSDVRGRVEGCVIGTVYYVGFRAGIVGLVV